LGEIITKVATEHAMPGYALRVAILKLFTFFVPVLFALFSLTIHCRSAVRVVVEITMNLNIVIT